VRERENDRCNYVRIKSQANMSNWPGMHYCSEWPKWFQKVSSTFSGFWFLGFFAAVAVVSLNAYHNSKASCYCAEVNKSANLEVKMSNACRSSSLVNSSHQILTTSVHLNYWNFCIAA